MKYIGNDWDDILKDEYDKIYFNNLMSIVNDEYKHYEVYPPKDDIFNALKLTSFKDTKVVIIGQDPYINPGQAHGLAFSVRPNVPIPPSLVNIYKEIHNDIGFNIPNHGCLISWAQQGVLLLNSVLTVRRGSSMSHKGIGWEKFTDAIIDKLNENKNDVIFMLWGNYAKSKGLMIDKEKHLVLTAAHPSPLAGGAFFGCKHFSRASQYLYEISSSNIDWQIPDV